jgi:hypothetical protein
MSVGSCLSLLFIGNSFTSFSNLPQLVADVASSEGWCRPTLGVNTPGGFTFEQHRSDEQTLRLIARGGWDAVILQQQSELPAFSAIDSRLKERTMDDAVELGKLVAAASPESPQTKIVLYQTWSRRPDVVGTKDWKAAYGNDTVVMQSRISAWYAAVQAKMDGKPLATVVAPVGDVWQRNFQSDSPLVLHDADGAHPSLAGSFVAALTIYATVYARGNVTASFRAGLEDDVALRCEALVNGFLGDVTVKQQTRPKQTQLTTTQLTTTTATVVTKTKEVAMRSEVAVVRVSAAVVLLMLFATIY